ncbi:hypothetical protein IEQ34_020794 [Dendrobium chrysotoxum]|uniref:Thioglucosidase n=1 Tax=Dendrobium chrysotoxum TaxID=161865 RepID=A0AAV7G1Q9_DENCH|nr:hypothetical protein IEQ34_020794 [Dendrobium chrysotoxum]
MRKVEKSTEVLASETSLADDKLGRYEGAVYDDGRGPTVWDKFAHSFGKQKFNQDDIVNVLMGEQKLQIKCFILKFTAYADGTGKVNQAGIDYYNKLINALLAKGKHKMLL